MAEFTESVLRQAVAAAPHGAGYCDPRNPHYSRIPRVQKYLNEIVGGWSFYYIYNLPEYHLQSHPTPDTAGEACVLLNILLISPTSSLINSMLQALHDRTPDLTKLLTTRLTVTLGYRDGRPTFTGSVMAILYCYEQSLALGKLQWLVERCGSRLDPTAILMELAISRLNHQFLDGSSLIDLLIKHGADPNGDGCFLTPLKASVYHGYASLSPLLLEAGANPNFTGSFPREAKRHHLPEWVEYTNATPLALLRRLSSECVSRGQLPQIERLLLDYGAVM
ncbi:uncharacterized protein PG986_008934 [Apiospora aurea]|uniref:Ankyrin n=1 Tax=Apiospora aurea TaxID=335848 RepID=A0ABR1Q698_9PEZI